MLRRPISHKQIAANRANAAKSTGPRTPEGKARSAQNARKHGFTASRFAVVRLEAGLFTDALDETLIGDEPFIPMCKELAGDGDIRITRAQNRNFALGEGFHRLAKKSNCWALFFRYQAQSEPSTVPWRNSTASKSSAVNYRTNPSMSRNPKRINTLTPPKRTRLPMSSAASKSRPSLPLSLNRPPNHLDQCPAAGQANWRSARSSTAAAAPAWPMRVYN